MPAGPKEKKEERRKQSDSYIRNRNRQSGGDAFPSGIDIAYQRRNRNRHARRKADTRARIQRRRKFMPVPCRRRQAYDVPSTVSRRTRRSPCSPLPPRLPFICSFARSLVRRSFSSSRLRPRTESRFLRVTQPSVGRPLIIFPRAAVPEFLNGG